MNRRKACKKFAVLNGHVISDHSQTKLMLAHTDSQLFMLALLACVENSDLFWHSCHPCAHFVYLPSNR
jgi:hypothetical protein